MSQRYDNKFIAIVRSTDQSDWSQYPTSGNITEYGTKETAQNAITVNYADGNQDIYQEMVIIDDRSFDETYTPVSGDPTYNDRYIAMVRSSSSSSWELYTGSGSTIEIVSDKTTFLTTIRGAYGDGNFRIFDSVVQSHSHSFVTVP